LKGSGDKMIIGFILGVVGAILGVVGSVFGLLFSLVGSASAAAILILVILGAIFFSPILLWLAFGISTVFLIRGWKWLKDGDRA